jgi:hypothetical protein
VRLIAKERIAPGPSCPYFRIGAKDDEPRCESKWKRFAQLLDDPTSSTFADIALQDAPTTIVTDEKKQ